MRILRCCVLLCLIVGSYSCEKSTEPPKPVEHDIAAGNSGGLLLAELPVEAGTVEVWARILEWDDTQQIAAIDIFLVNRSSASIEAPLHLVVVSINPSAVEFLNPDGLSDDGFPFKEFWEEFGTDGLLEPGDMSEPVTHVFAVGEYREFSIGFRLDFDVESPGFIAGVVFRDENQNKVQDGQEPGLGRIVIHLRFEGSDEIATTGSTGEFNFPNLRSGAYSVSVDLPSGTATSTPNPVVVVLLEGDDGTTGSQDDVDFGVYVAEPKVIRHDFDDGQVPEWGGTATMVNVDGTLQLIANSTAEWRWEIFDHLNPGLYSSGEFEFDAKFGAEGYFFDLKGHSRSNIWDHNFGPTVYFVEGVVYALEEGPVDTGYRYDADAWYRVRVEFDNHLGEKGRYALYITDLGGGGSEQTVGEYNYRATNGALVDIAEFGFGLKTYDLVPSTSLFVDNVRLEVR